MPAECLEEAMVCLIVTAADSGRVTTPGITATASSWQLLSCASFYELPNVRAVLPKVLVAQLVAAQDRLTSVAGSSFGSIFSRMEAADMQPCITAANALAVAKPATSNAANADADAAASATFALVRVLSWIPAEYFATLSELSALLTALCRLDKVLIAAVLCGAVRCGADACHSVSVLRQVVTRLVAVSDKTVLAWTAETQIQWLARSLDVLVLATQPRGTVQHPEVEAVALATGALLGQLSNGASRGASVPMVLAAVAAACSDLRDLAVSCASHVLPAEEASAFLPRTVQLLQRQQRRLPPPHTLSHASHTLATSKVALAASVLTAVVDARPSAEWLTLQQLVADALELLCASAASRSVQSLALCRPLFKALAATLQLEASAGSELGAHVGTERLTGLLHAAAQMLAHGSSGGIELLLFLQAAVKVLIQRDALPDSMCHLLLSLYTGVLQAEILGTVASEGASMRSAALDALSALAATGIEQQQALLIDTIIAAAQDVPADDGAGAPVQWASLFATLQLLAFLVRVFPKQVCAANAERFYAAAFQAGSQVGHAVSTPLALLEQVSLSAVSAVDALLKSRSRFPLRGSSVACALAVPATLFDGSSRLADLSGVGSHSVFAACCSLLVTATRCRPHELQRCMPLLSSSSRVLAGALLESVRGLDDSHGTPVSATLLICAAELGALYVAVAAEESVRAARLAAHSLVSRSVRRRCTASTAPTCSPTTSQQSPRPSWTRAHTPWLRRFATASTRCWAHARHLSCSSCTSRSALDSGACGRRCWRS